MFKTKLRKIGNSLGVIIPRKKLKCYNIGNVITLEIKENVITSKQNVITSDKEIAMPKKNVITFKNNKAKKKVITKSPKDKLELTNLLISVLSIRYITAPAVVNRVKLWIAVFLDKTASFKHR